MFNITAIFSHEVRKMLALMSLKGITIDNLFIEQILLRIKVSSSALGVEGTTMYNLYFLPRSKQ
jgi:hypothetical protein